MQLRDTTTEANSREDMQAYYLYHVESPHSRWAVAVEQVEPERFNVSVLYREPAWDVYGVIRYWGFRERSMAEARYLEAQRILGELDEEAGINEVVKALPADERLREDEE